MLVLSHIFGRRVSRATDSEDMAEKIRKSPSMVFLPPMPKQASDVLVKHNADTLSIFTTYVKTFADQYVKNAEDQLPLTQYAVGRQGSTTEAKALDFLPSLPAPQARSAFVALSGHGDAFPTIGDLCSSSRQGIFLESAIVPHLTLHPTESRQPLNAYLVDFFVHGNLQALEDANGIRREDVWFVLNDFSLVLGTICAALAIYLGQVQGRDADEELLNVMGQGDAVENDKDEQEAAEAAAAEVALPKIDERPTAPTAAPVPRKGKRGVVDEWGVAEDALQEEERQEWEIEERGTDVEEYDRLMTVYRAFRKLKAEFDGKFKEIWA